MIPSITPTAAASAYVGMGVFCSRNKIEHVLVELERLTKKMNPVPVADLRSLTFLVVAFFFLAH